MRALLRSPRYRALQQTLIAMRDAKGLTQTDLAKRLSRPQSFVAKVEGGERRLDVFEFVDIVRALGSDPQRVLAKLAIMTNTEDS
jgi:predicted transcriptional regulator